MRKVISKRKIKYDICVLAAFVLSSVTMLIFCAFTKFRTGEISSLQAGDMLNLYVPAIRSFVRNLYSGQGLNYSWDLFLGMNAVPYYTSVMGGSFINVVYILFPFISPEVFVIIAIVVKTGFIGASFAYYSKKVLKVDGMASVVFALFYSLCGFQVCINIINYIWMDLLYLLPLIICAIRSLMEERKWKGLVCLYAYSFLCCFYIAYIVGIFTALYLVLYVVVCRLWKTNGIKGLCGKLFQYAGVVLWAAGIVACGLLPTAIFLVTKFPPDATVASADLVQQNIVLLLSRFLVGIPFTQYFNLPFLYCGIPCLILLPMFFTSKEIDKKEKLLYGILLGIMLISCVNLPLYILWHGFDAPDGWDFRFSFIIAFLVVSMACKAAKNINGTISKKTVLTSIAECVCICGILWYCNLKGDRAYVAPMNWNLLFLTGWVITGTLFAFKFKTKKRWKSTVIVMMAMLEVLVNAGLQHDTFRSQKEIDNFAKEAKGAIETLQNDTSFYRIQTENSLHENADSYWGYKGITDLCSFENYETRNCLYQLGFYASPRYMTGYGLNPLTQMLLGVKYRVHFSDDAEVVQTTNIAFYEQYLGMGFMVNKKILDYSFEEDVFNNCNHLASTMAGENIELFTLVPDSDIEVQEAGIGLEYENTTKYTMKRMDDNSDIVQLIFSMPNTGKDIYGITKAFTIGNLPGRPYIYELFHPKDRGVFGMKYTKRLDSWGDQLIYDIVMEKGVTENQDSFIDYQFSYLNREEVEKLYGLLRENCFEVNTYKNGYVSGNVQVKDNNSVLFTSIPYDSGWKLDVKDKQTGRTVTTAHSISLLDGAFLGIDFEEVGEYELTLKYQAPGAMLGNIISFVAILLFVMNLLYLRIRKIHKDNEVLE